jgi:hypothetical protein
MYLVGEKGPVLRAKSEAHLASEKIKARDKLKKK